MEAADVENNEYTAFDCEGLGLKPTVQPDDVHVRLVTSATSEFRPYELTTILRSALSSVGEGVTRLVEDDVGGMQLEQLIDQARLLNRRQPPRLRLWPSPRRRTDA